MSIAIIRGPEPAQPESADSNAIPKEVISLLVNRASMAGKTIALRICRSDADLLHCLSRANAAGFEFVMIDPGACASNSEQLQERLTGLGMPYIEVHDDHVGALEPTLAVDCGPRLSLIQGYGSQSYMLALSIALEHLGCAECENDVHVGI